MKNKNKVNYKSKNIPESANNSTEKSLKSKYSKVNPAFETILGKLQKIHPKTFPVNSEQVLALKVGINKDVINNQELMKKLGISNTYLNKFFRWYTSSKNYQTITQIEGNARYDLKGNETGKVTKDQANT